MGEVIVLLARMRRNDELRRIDEPKEKMFAPFGDARHKIQGEAQKGRET